MYALAHKHILDIMYVWAIEIIYHGVIVNINDDRDHDDSTPVIIYGVKLKMKNK